MKTKLGGKTNKQSQPVNKQGGAGGKTHPRRAHSRTFTHSQQTAASRRCALRGTIKVCRSWCFRSNCAIVVEGSSWRASRPIACPPVCVSCVRVHRVRPLWWAGEWGGESSEKRNGRQPASPAPQGPRARHAPTVSVVLTHEIISCSGRMRPETRTSSIELYVAIIVGCPTPPEPLLPAPLPTATCALSAPNVRGSSSIRRQPAEVGCIINFKHHRTHTERTPNAHNHHVATHTIAATPSALHPPP